MSGYAAELYLQPSERSPHEGELFYSVRDFLLDGIFSRPSSRELRDYLNQEEPFTHGSDSADRGGSGVVLFAFDSWGEGQDPLARLAAHHCQVLIAHELEAVDRIARGEGFAVRREQHLFGRVVAQAGVYAVSPTEPASPERVMCGWCGCGVCQKVRAERQIAEPALEEVPRAWALLASDPVGARLASAVAAELATAITWSAPTGPVLADWLRERGLSLTEPALLGLALRFLEAR